MNTVDDQFVKKLIEHPDLEPRLEFKGELKHRLKTKAQSMQKKETFYRFAKLGSVIVVAAGLLLGAFTETGSDMLRSGYYFIVGDDSAPVGDNQEEEKELEQDNGVELDENDKELEDSTDVAADLEPFLVEMHDELVEEGVAENLAERLVKYLQAVYEGDVVTAHSYTAFTDADPEQFTDLINHYRDNVDMTDFRFQINQNDRDGVVIDIIYKDKANYNLYNLAQYLILNTDGGSINFFEDDLYSLGNSSFSEDDYRNIYSQVRNSRENWIWAMLDPIPFVQFYFYVEQLRDFDTLYDLHVLDEEKYSFPSREQFIEEQERRADSDLFSTRLEEDLEYMYQVCFDELCNEVGVRLVMKDEESPLLFRLVSENGTWKADWLPVQ